MRNPTKHKSRIKTPKPQGEGSRDAPDDVPTHPGGMAPQRSWLPGRKGQGGEGLSDGYGGSHGKGDGPSGPQSPGEVRKSRR